jgi:RHS repeat-associated protein
MTMPGRSFNSNAYRYGFNGMEKDDEIKGNENSYTTHFRQYDPRLGRWLSIDPLSKDFPWQSPYVAFDNNPLNKIDPDGAASHGPKSYVRRGEQAPSKDASYVQYHYFQVEDQNVKGGYKYLKTWTYHNVEKSIVTATNRRAKPGEYVDSKSGRTFIRISEQEYNKKDRKRVYCIYWTKYYSN